MHETPVTDTQHHPIATLQVDVDPFWFISSLYERNTAPTPPDEPTIYQTALPIYLDRFREHGVRATFFIVGRDLEDERNLPVLERALNEGHELANHSLSHPTTLGTLPPADMAREIDGCAELLQARLGVRPLGFKAPAYGVTPAMLEHLARSGYVYDSSVHPSAAISLVKAVQRHVLRYRQSSVQFGNWRAALAPLSPYRPHPQDIYRTGDSPLVELPVSTAPWLRTPCHFSFVNAAGLWLFSLASGLWRLAGTSFVNYAFHAVDILDRGHVPARIADRPGLAKPTSAKLHDLDTILSRLTADFHVMTSIEAARVFG